MDRFFELLYRSLRALREASPVEAASSDVLDPKYQAPLCAMLPLLPFATSANSSSSSSSSSRKTEACALLLSSRAARVGLLECFFNARAYCPTKSFDPPGKLANAGGGDDKGSLLEVEFLEASAGSPGASPRARPPCLEPPWPDPPCSSRPLGSCWRDVDHCFVPGLGLTRGGGG